MLIENYVFCLKGNHLMIESNKTATLLAFTAPNLIYFYIYLTNGNSGFLVLAVVRPRWPHYPVSSDLWFVCFMRQKRVAFDTHKQLWCWVLLLQIDSLLYLLWKMHFHNLKDQLLFSLMVFRQKWKEKSMWIKKQLQQKQSAYWIIFINVLVFFLWVQHYLRHG